MSLSVDGIKDEIRQYAPEIDWLVNSFAYLGGVPNKKNVPEIKVENFRGCMKKVFFLRKKKPHHLPIIRIVHVSVDTYRCKFIKSDLSCFFFFN